MPKAIDWQSKNGIPASVWIDGRKVSCTVLWLTNTHMELIASDPLTFSEGKQASLLVRDFISFPMRVESHLGYHAVLSFNRPLQQSIVETITAGLIESRLTGMRNDLEERAIPFPVRSDLEAPFEDGQTIAA